jgi:hypothetical protein
MMRSPRLRAFLGLCASLALIWTVSAAVLRSASAPPSLHDAKYASAERLVFYRLEPGETLRVRLPADAEALRLATHLVLPPGVTYAPERQYVYGLHLRLQGPQGEELLNSPLFTRTRQSKAEPVEDTWLKESAFTVDPKVQLTDERGFLVTLPPQARTLEALLNLHYTGPQGALLVRLYTRTTSAPLPLSVSQRNSALRRAEVRAERATFVPWEKLSPESQGRLIAGRWQRLGAEGEAGQDYRTEPVYRTDFRLPLVEVAEAAEERLEARRAVAINVSGPAKLLLRLWSPSSEETPQAREPAQVSLRALGEAGTEQAWSFPAPRPGELASHPLDIPAGRHSLLLLNTSEEPLRYTLEGPTQVWLAPPGLKGPTQAPSVALVPDVYRSEAHVTGPGCPALELEVGAGADDLGRLLRVEARGLGVPADSDPTALSLTFLDGRGRPLGKGRLDIPSTPAPFESADLPPLPPDYLPCVAGPAPRPPAHTAEVTERPASVSLPASTRLFLPEGTRRVRLHASRPTALQLYSFLHAPEGQRASAPYGEEGLLGVRWRHAPLERRNWYPLRPANHQELTTRGARVMVLSQVRLEALEPRAASPGPSGEPVALLPVGTVVSQEFLEPVAEVHGQTGTPDAARTSFSLLKPGWPVRLRFDAREPGRPELRLGLEGPEGLGGQVEVLIDGVPVHRSVLHATRARELLPLVPPGEHEVLLRSSAPGLTATLNRPPSRSAGTLRSRTVFRLDGKGLRVLVRKRDMGPVTLNLVLLGQAPEGSPEPRVRVTLDQGKPRRNSGMLLSRLTPASRELALPPSERAPAWPAGQPQSRWYSRTLHITLGEDVAPGAHWVHVTPVGSGPLWARFFMYGDAHLEGAPRQWNRQGWELEDAP